MLIDISRISIDMMTKWAS